MSIIATHSHCPVYGNQDDDDKVEWNVSHKRWCTGGYGTGTGSENHTAEHVENVP